MYELPGLSQQRHRQNTEMTFQTTLPKYIKKIFLLKKRGKTQIFEQIKSFLRYIQKIYLVIDL